MLFNYILESAILANILAQCLKVPIHYFKERRWRFGLIFSTGGMPSSHSAFVASLATTIAIRQGIDSIYFAIAFCLAAVVIYDAMGIRRHAGKHAAVLNKLIADLKKSGNLFIFQDERYQKQFKELLGHEPVETFWGTVFGIIVATIYNWLLI